MNYNENFLDADHSDWHHSLKSKGQQMLLQYPLGERPDSRSSMGRFIHDIIEHSREKRQDGEST